MPDRQRLTLTLIGAGRMGQRLSQELGDPILLPL